MIHLVAIVLAVGAENAPILHFHSFYSAHLLSFRLSDSDLGMQLSKEALQVPDTGPTEHTIIVSLTPPSSIYTYNGSGRGKARRSSKGFANQR